MLCSYTDFFHSSGNSNNYNANSAEDVAVGGFERRQAGPVRVDSSAIFREEDRPPQVKQVNAN